MCIFPEALPYLDLWRLEREKRKLPARRPLLCTLEGEPVSRVYVGAMLARLAERAGITNRVNAHGLRQAQSKLSDAEKAIEARIPEAWIWCLVPDQQDAASQTVWLESRLQGQGSLPERAAKKLEFDEELLTVIGPARLKHELDRNLWKDKPHLSLKQLWHYLASYLYLPRLRDSQVLLDCVKDAITRGGMYCEHFA